MRAPDRSRDRRSPTSVRTASASRIRPERLVAIARHRLQRRERVEGPGHGERAVCDRLAERSAALDRLWDRHRPEQRRRRAPAQDGERRHRVARARRVLSSARPVVVRRGRLPLDPRVHRAKVQRPAAPGLVAAVAEHVERLVGHYARRLAAVTRLQPHERALDPGARPERGVGGRVLDRTGHRVVGLREPACLQQRGAERAAAAPASRRQRGGALQQPRAGGCVPAAQRGLAGGLQPCGRARRQLALSRAVAPQLAQQPAGLRQVMAGGLVLTAPGRGLLVEVGAALFRDAEVRRVPDERVFEAEGVRTASDRRG